MKSCITTASLLALASLASASPMSKRQNTCIVQTIMNPNPNQVETSIKQWNDDVNTVNAFLDDAAGLLKANNPQALVSRAQKAFKSASDEPCQLGTLGSLKDDVGLPAFTCAVNDLENVRSKSASSRI